jgi:protocatechuate 3,4-dioxygenase alpha subunit
MPTPTSSQTIGPFWHLVVDPAASDLTRFGASGERIELTGRVSDGLGAPVDDACVEIWQASPPAGDVFPGWGRAATDAQGQFRFLTVKPAAIAGEAPHISIVVMARGLLKPLWTRCYFDGDPLNDRDPLLRSIADAARRQTLLARGDGGRLRFDIRLQGQGETVFLEV